MPRQRVVPLGLTAIALCALLAYLRDPAWLMRIDSGFRGWDVAQDGTRYRWTGGHASFFVPSDASPFSLPLRTTFTASADPPVTVTITIDDRPAQRVILTDAEWHPLTLVLPTPGVRRARRIDIRVVRTRAGNRGVQVGEVRAP